MAYSIEIYPCNTASFTAPTNPANLVLDRSPDAGNPLVYNLNPSYKDLFISSVPVQCPVERFELLDTSGVAWANPSISMTDASTVQISKLHVKND